MPPRRSYDQYCSAARALDLVGDRWTLLIVRELLAGPRRYTDLHADLPGVSTDVLASRLKDMERDGLATRRRLPPPGAATVYELAERGRGLLPVLQAFGAWGEAELGERRPTDAVRAHWFALPLLRALEGLGVRGLVEVRLEEGDFHVRAGKEAADTAPVYGDGPAPAPADARLTLTTPVSEAVARGTLSLAAALRAGDIGVEGEGPVAKALREG
ncbi:transcriptional regulator [Streptomyces sp. SID8366]|uniref:winged helix-turn-helix transcriptional regulator n=1 Tax=unclassified Streptomyces TaxID=2593676 RepID=UPI000DBA9FDE|nr:winged helix-turn-helix transcriptional regulator [Streptomyces sp. PsTaAH-130]MYU05312.1 transcriptional regulator [Streptomyces sp. SID8366]MYU61424.1 transcriptional regulator [Streptomyces sp. SID69]RAJ66193.1 HxlR family transcriptional regulator [Streptomyces sp. PsTaAH-130]